MLAVLPPCCHDVDTLLLRVTREDVPHRLELTRPEAKLCGPFSAVDHHRLARRLDDDVGVRTTAMIGVDRRDVAKAALPHRVAQRERDGLLQTLRVDRGMRRHAENQMCSLALA